MPDTSHNLIGTTIAHRYRVERVIGQGGMGVVLQAVHVDLGEKVAVKVLLPYAASDRALAERFIQEAKIAASIKSDHVARVFDFGKNADGSAYIIMELLEGTTLGDRIEKGGPVPFQEAATIVYQASLGILEAHARRLVHRDIKPDNLFLVKTRTGHTHVKVLDFGISKKLDTELKLTQTGAVFGSPHYMSPEQLRAAKGIDARTDVWSLGAVLFEAIAGVPPFEGESMTSLALQITQDPTPDLRLNGVPNELAQVIESCLAKNPAQRPADAQALATLLDPWVTQRQLGGSMPPGPLVMQVAFGPVVRVSSLPYPDVDRSSDRELQISSAATVPAIRAPERRASTRTPKAIGVAAASLLALGVGLGVLAKARANSDPQQGAAGGTSVTASVTASATASATALVTDARDASALQVVAPAQPTPSTVKPRPSAIVAGSSPKPKSTASAAPNPTPSALAVPAPPPKIVKPCPPGAPPGTICDRGD